MNIRLPRALGRPDAASVRGLTVVLALALALVLTFALTACGGEGDEAGEPSADPSVESSAAGTTSSPSGSADASGSPTSSASPAVAPASGTLIKNKYVQLRAPEGWKFERLMGDTVTALDEKTHDAMYVAVIDKVYDDDLDRLARDALRSGGSISGGKRMPDRTLVDRQAYHLVNDEDWLWVADYGTFVGEGAVSITFEFVADSPADREQVIESVLSTIEWR